mgnify:CR=1 FL=1
MNTKITGLLVNVGRNNFARNEKYAYQFFEVMKPGTNYNTPCTQTIVVMFVLIDASVHVQVEMENMQVEMENRKAPKYLQSIFNIWLIIKIDRKFIFHKEHALILSKLYIFNGVLASLD